MRQFWRGFLSGSVLTEREVDNIISSYQKDYKGRLVDFIRSVWKEAYDEGHDTGYKLGVVEGFNSGKMQKR